MARLRAVLAGEAAPASGDLTDAELRAYASRYSGKRPGHASGWRELPQCAGCRAILKYPGAQCVACGFMDGAGYIGVPAKTSHLERWR